MAKTIEMSEEPTTPELSARKSLERFLHGIVVRPLRLSEEEQVDYFREMAESVKDGTSYSDGGAVDLWSTAGMGES